MRYLVSASEMREYDSNTIEKIGIPACVLMERAALAAADALCRCLQDRADAGGRAAGCRSKGRDSGRGRAGDSRKKRGGSGCVLVMAGMGNNGGDGLAAARILLERGWQVEVWCVGNREKASAQWRQQRQILESYPVEFTDAPRRTEYRAAVDALFGVGLSREVEGAYGEAVDIFNGLEGFKLALDLPSGIDSDTGRVWGRAVRADMTVTFGFCKRGLVLYPGCEYAGEVRTVDIGIGSGSFFGREPGMYAYDEDLRELLPPRPRNGHKGTFGKVLLLAGSQNMAGAAVLAARAAYRTGAGMVKVVTPPENRVILQQAVPEALLGDGESLREDLEWADVIAAGCGLGKSARASRCLERIIRESAKPLLLDADALNLLAEREELKTVLGAQGRKGRDIVLTPHVGELSRLLGKGESVEECRRNLALEGGRLAAALCGTVAAKDARTFVCRQGRSTCVNLTGNSGMGTAGSGDVLAGMTAALMAQGMKGFEAAAVGTYAHGLAGDRVAARVGEYACMAGDLAENILAEPLPE